MSDFGAALANTDLRFFVFERVLMMILAVIFAHVGVATTKRAAEPVLKHRRAAIWFSLSLVALLLGIPWDCPLLPGF